MKHAAIAIFALILPALTPAALASPECVLYQCKPGRVIVPCVGAYKLTPPGSMLCGQFGSYACCKAPKTKKSNKDCTNLVKLYCSSVCKSSKGMFQFCRPPGMSHSACVSKLGC
jgi:hypothetical protein